MCSPLNYIAPDDYTGYGIAAAQYIHHLQRAGHSVVFQPLRPGPGLGLWYECAAPSSTSLPLQPEADTILHVVPEYHASLVQWLRRAGVRGRIIAMTTWEASRLPEHWPPILNLLDAVIVPSEWNRETFLSSGVSVPVHVLPHISEFQGDLPPRDSIPPAFAALCRGAAKTVFYSIATQMHRKGNDLLIAAFQMAFPGRDDVRLVLKTSPNNLEPSQSSKIRAIQDLFGWDALTRAASKDKRIVLIRQSLSSEQIAALHALGDCYVTCSRGEGWGIGLYDALLFGKPALAPSLGGHLAFFPADSANLVASRLVAGKPARQSGHITQDVFWVETDVAAMAQRMTEIDAERDSFGHRAERTAQAMRARFHPETITKQFGSILRQIQATTIRPQGAAQR